MFHNICPYCLKLIATASRDHIFNDFLGGKRTIASCGDCNKKFGNTFEPRAAVDTLHKLYISITSWGLPLKIDVPAWRSAFEHRGLNFDLTVKNGKVSPRLSAPIVHKDTAGKTVSVTHASQEEAEKMLKNLKKKGKAPNAIVEKVQVEISPYQLPLDYLVDSNLMRLAVKMCMALATRLPNYEPIEILLGRMVLNGDDLPHKIVTIVFDDYPSLDALREPLSHVVYVERHDARVIGVVQFFGVVQLHCFIGRSDEKVENSAILGTLDPLTGIENFGAIKSILGLADPINDPFEQPLLVTAGTDRWSRKFEQAAVARGATNSVRLEGRTEIGESK